MRFYFDQTLSHQYSDIEECQRECRGDVGPLLPAMRDIFPPSPAEQQRIALMRLQHVPVLYRQMITEESWLLCNPTGPGYVIVMDAAALAFFERFRTPCTLADLAAQARPTDQIVQATTLLFKAGLLTGTTPEQYWQEEDNSALTAWLHVTNSCNLRCSYCYIDKSQESMSQDTAYRAIDAVFRSANIHGFKRVQLKYAGGEASLRLAQVIAIHDYALQLAQQHAIALGACILSNGVYLSPRAMDDLKKRHIGDRTCYDLGKVGDATVCLLRANETDSSLSEQIQELSPACIIILGTAWGFNYKGQIVGSLLIPDRLVIHGIEAENKVSTQLIKHFHAGNLMLNRKTKKLVLVTFGPMFSSTKVIEDPQTAFRDIHESVPDAIGIVTSGATLFSLAQNHQANCLLVTGVSALVDAAKDQDEADAEDVLRRGAEFILQVIALGGFHDMERDGLWSR